MTVQLLKGELQPPVASSQDYGWKNILVEEFHQPPGQETYQNLTRHTLCISLNSRPSRLSHVMGDRRHISLFSKGDITITPISSTLVSQWNQKDQYLRIQLTSDVLQQVAQDSLTVAPKQVELLPEFRVRHPQIEQISLMLLSELRNGGLTGSLYVESLTTVLAVHLLKAHSVLQPCVALYQGGLSDRHLLRVIDYINAHLADEIQLSDLATLADLSQFHFSRLFKQSTGVTPHQYVLQQRVERAKQLLKTTDLSVMDIALLCGFSSHSHLGKWIQHYTGLSPKAYRAS
ncbi:MAG: AraC family transcriptional regulator [Oculatellaceae cyanobacterium bins.114]|nr:AraC family transcriptional regulator [Oculatellaceae cyanobacterium bins.114]